MDRDFETGSSLDSAKASDISESEEVESSFSVSEGSESFFSESEGVESEDYDESVPDSDSFSYSEAVSTDEYSKSDGFVVFDWGKYKMDRDVEIQLRRRSSAKLGKRKSAGRNTIFELPADDVAPFNWKKFAIRHTYSM
jgi:hypothetical protein